MASTTLTLGSKRRSNFVLITTGSANVLAEVVVVGDAVTFCSRNNDAKVTFGDPAGELGDGDALGAADYIELIADVPRLFSTVGASQSWLLTSATGSTVIEVVVEGAL